MYGFGLLHGFIWSLPDSIPVFEATGTKQWWGMSWGAFRDMPKAKLLLCEKAAAFVIPSEYLLAGIYRNWPELILQQRWHA